MSKKLNLAALNRKIDEITMLESLKVKGGFSFDYKSCEEYCEGEKPEGSPGNGDIYKNGGTLIIKPPVD